MDYKQCVSLQSPSVQHRFSRFHVSFFPFLWASGTPNYGFNTTKACDFLTFLLEFPTFLIWYSSTKQRSPQMLRFARYLVANCHTCISRFKRKRKERKWTNWRVWPKFSLQMDISRIFFSLDSFAIIYWLCVRSYPLMAFVRCNINIATIKQTQYHFPDFKSLISRASSFENSQL